MQCEKSGQEKSNEKLTLITLELTGHFTDGVLLARSIHWPCSVPEQYSWWLQLLLHTLLDSSGRSEKLISDRPILRPHLRGNKLVGNLDGQKPSQRWMDVDVYIAWHVRIGGTS